MCIQTWYRWVLPESAIFPIGDMSGEQFMVECPRETWPCWNFTLIQYMGGSLAENTSTPHLPCRALVDSPALGCGLDLVTGSLWTEYGKCDGCRSWEQVVKSLWLLSPVVSPSLLLSCLPLAANVKLPCEETHVVTESPANSHVSELGSWSAPQAPKWSFQLPALANSLSVMSWQPLGQRHPALPTLDS